MFGPTYRLIDESPHFALVDAVNAAKTQQEHDRAESKLDGFRRGLEAAGLTPDLCACDIHVQPALLTTPESELDSLRPMCCGVYLDWQPA